MNDAIGKDAGKHTSDSRDLVKIRRRKIETSRPDEESGMGKWRQITMIPYARYTAPRKGGGLDERFTVS